jgi:predicted tellurium resistance membrane protein TerC
MTNNDPISITSAGPSLSEDQTGRARRYFISMMIRTVCFILTVILPTPYRWVALAGALLLPYVAVIVANAGRETIQKRTVFFDEGAKALPQKDSDRKSD